MFDQAYEENAYNFLNIGFMSSKYYSYIKESNENRWEISPPYYRYLKNCLANEPNCSYQYHITKVEKIEDNGVTKFYMFEDNEDEEEEE